MITKNYHISHAEQVLIHGLLTWPESAMACAHALTIVLGVNRAERLSFVQDGSAEKLSLVLGDRSTHEQLNPHCFEALFVAAHLLYVDEDKGQSLHVCLLWRCALLSCRHHA